ncbi:MAG TPA: HEAT repeat domain-containing protein [Gemmataceae bacterium]|jgi:hypothetical protein
MKRIHAAALAAALAGVTPAWAQQPAAPAPSDAITLTGPDGTAHTYKVLRTSRHPAGGTAYEVRDPATGDTMTVVENANPGDVKTVAKAENNVTRSAKAADPILQPGLYGSPRVQPQFADSPKVRPVAAPAAKPDTQYTRPPVPAARRWFGWWRKDPPPAAAAPAQSSSRRAKPAPAPVPPTSVELAAYNPDPVIRLIASLNDELLPSMREVSAEALAHDGRGRPDVVEALVRGAQTDPAPSVRACCCRCLADMQVRSPECLAILKGLADDREQSVRTAAAAALAVLEQP